MEHSRAGLRPRVAALAIGRRPRGLSPGSFYFDLTARCCNKVEMSLALQS